MLKVSQIAGKIRVQEAQSTGEGGEGYILGAIVAEIDGGHTPYEAMHQFVEAWNAREAEHVPAKRSAR